MTLADISQPFTLLLLAIIALVMVAGVESANSGGGVLPSDTVAARPASPAVAPSTLVVSAPPPTATTTFLTESPATQHPVGNEWRDDALSPSIVIAEGAKGSAEPQEKSQGEGNGFTVTYVMVGALVGSLVLLAILCVGGAVLIVKCRRMKKQRTFEDAPQSPPRSSPSAHASNIQAPNVVIRSNVEQEEHDPAVNSKINAYACDMI